MEQRPNKTRYQRAIASLPASNGQTYSYKATYNPATGVVTLWRDGVQWVSWTDSTPLTSGQYIALRTSQSSVSFDNVRVSAQSGVVTYPHADHLGSVSLMTNQVGSALVNTTARYFPFGDWRTKPTADLTERGFTGHRHNNLGSNDIGLIYMNARFYVPYLNRFLSADTIVPDPANPQSFNRYSYVNNNPLNFTDPTGHRECGANNGCSGEALPPLPLLPPKLPSHPPPGLNDDYGQPAWDGLQAIQQMSGGWWGAELDAQEAIMLILNHELGTELGRDGHSAPRDVLINQYNAYCTGGVWSTECMNKFWGYSHVIRESRVALDGGRRFDKTEHVQWLRETATGFLNHTLQSVNPALMHYGNAYGESARRLLRDYDNGDMTYATYVSISGYSIDPVTKQFILDANQNRIVSSIFAVQTYGQWQLTGTLQYWTYPQ